jgi:hypothetical protein
MSGLKAWASILEINKEFEVCINLIEQDRKLPTEFLEIVLEF